MTDEPVVLVSSDEKLAELFIWLAKNATVVEITHWAWIDQDEEQLEDFVRRVMELFEK